MASSTTMREKGQITIPVEIRRAARLEEGDPVEVEVVEEGILLRPQKVIDATQAWFWTATWQAGERAASEEGAADAGTTYESTDEFLSSLDE
jgi:AbrB family looped-hinge helix DNA binding protein